MTTIQVRIDEKTKAKAKKVFRKMGLDMSSGVKLYLARIVQDEAVPFTVRTVNGYTPEQERQIMRETEYAEKHGKKYTSVKALMRDILK
ncbi:MAG: type II toxin-antitoxin system RelB/DinJ family antitoxin [Patescibacteria group bacterium]